DLDDCAVPPAFELDEGAVDLAAQLVPHAVQRVLGDVESESLLLQPEQLALLELVGRNGRVMLPGRLRVPGKAVEDRRLSREPVGLGARAEIDRLFEHAQEALARRTRRVERSGLDERLECSLVDELR